MIGPTEVDHGVRRRLRRVAAWRRSVVGVGCARGTALMSSVSAGRPADRVDNLVVAVANGTARVNPAHRRHTVAQAPADPAVAGQAERVVGQRIPLSTGRGDRVTQVAGQASVAVAPPGQAGERRCPWRADRLAVQRGVACVAAVVAICGAGRPAVGAGRQASAGAGVDLGALLVRGTRVVERTLRGDTARARL